jgi:cell division septal protein FtsQ
MPGVTDAAPSNSNIIDQSSTSAGDLNSVAFGNGIFVAVGQEGISTSTNGVDWSISKKVGSPKLNSIVFANGLFLAIDGSEKAVYKSADGESWTKTTLSITPERLKAVNGKFFVWQSVYKNGTNPPSYDVTLLQSSDGVVWTDTRITSTNTIFGMQMLTDIAYGQNKYVVSANNAVYYTSTDLINWTTVTLTNLVIDHYNSNWPFVTNVMYLKDRFFSYIVTPFAKKVFTSTDGANWTVDASWDNKQFYGGASLNGSYLLYGQGVIYKSAAAPLDSTQWTSSDTHTTMMVNNMVYGNGKYVASGGSGLLVSSDLSAWSNVSGNLKSIAKDGDGNYIAVSSGEYGSIYKSNSSAVWNDVTSSKLPGMNAVTYGAGKFIAVTNKENYNLNAKVVTSTNGDTWTVTDSGVQDNLSGVAFGANQYVAVSDYGGIYSSVNGNAWTERFKNGDYAFNTVTYLNNQFVALGMNYNPSTYEPDNVVIAKSSDGVQWGTPLEIGFPNTSLKGIAYDGRAYILVGEDTLSQQAVILTTEDLVTFTKVTISADALNNISFGNGSFLAVGLKGELFTSADGSTWTQETSDLTSNLNGIIYDGNNFKVVGDHFTKMTLNLGPTLAYSLTATAATLTPVVGVDNAITLTVKNSLGDTDTTFTGTKEVTVAGYGAAPDGTYGSFGGTALTASPSKINVSFVEGVAQVNLKLNRAGAQAVLFSQAGVASPTATALNIISVAGSTATMKLITGVSAPPTNGGSFAQQPVITLLDQFGNVNTSDNSTVVSVSKKDAGSWTLTGNMTQTAVAGIVTFTDLGATNAAGITGAQLAFDATNLAQITSVAVNLPQPQGAQSLTATAATLTPVVGVDNAITLTVKNSLGDTDTTFTGTKEVTVAGYGAAPDGTYGSFGGTALAASPSKINVSFVEGVAQVNLKLNRAGAQAVVFSQAGVASPAATALNIISVAGSTATMKLTTGVSAPQTNGGSFAQQPVITLLDQFGNVNTSDNSTVVSVSKKDAGSWTLTGNMTQTAVAGIVTFTDLGATNAAGITGAQLAFDATNLAQITSVAVNLPQPQGAQSLTATAATLTPVVGVDNAITLTVKNSLGDTDTMFTGTKEVTVAGYGAAPDGTYGSLGGAALTASPSKINVSFVEGVTQVNLKLNRAGAQAVVFSQAGVASPAATALNIISVAGSTATLKLTTGVSAPQTNGGSFAQQPVITLLDQFGNVNTSDNSTVVSVSKKDAGSWTLTGNMTQTAVAGIVTFTDLGATNAAGITGAQLAFDAAGHAEITSAVIDLTWPELAAPSIETVTAGNGHIRITWSPVYGTDSYAVYQSTASGVYGAEVATISGSENSYDAVGLINGTAYYFIVKAVNPDGISPASNEVTRTPQVPAPGAPILHSPVASNGLIGLTWDPVKGAIGYTIYQGISSGIYETKVATVSESVYNYDVTGLINGESYYFVVKASNPGGESAASNEVSTKPRTSPSAPTDLIAVAGDGEATVTFAVPDSNGGTPITNYEVTASPGNIVTVGATSPITVTGLANGTTYSFSVKAINSAGSSVASEVSNSVTPKSSTEVEITPTPTPQTPTSTTAPTVTATPTPSSNIVEVLVNGKVENAGTATVSEQNGQTITTIVVDQAKIEQRIDKEGQNAIITIPVTATSDVIIGELNGQIIKNMEQKQAQLIIRTPKGTYTLSAAQIDISAISEQFGTGIALKDMKVQISISVPTADVLKRIEMLSGKEGLTLVAQPLDFTVKVTYAGKTIEVTQFNTYVERTIPLADGVDLKKITTGLVFEAGGTFRHVPTQIVVIDGKGYARIHSLTNSTYFIVQDPQSFKDVTTHWAKDIVNEMASRKVINGIGNELFNPSQEITRAEFAAIIVRGLGLKLESGTTTFTDVKISDWYNDAVQTAYSYKLINGFEDGAFRPTDKITREQAMSMIAKAMIITDLKAKLPSIEASELLHSYTDAIEASGWAKSGITDTLQAGIITGRSGNVLAPKAFITRAEVAAIIQRLLQQSDLI